MWPWLEVTNCSSGLSVKEIEKKNSLGCSLSHKRRAHFSSRLWLAFPSAVSLHTSEIHVIHRPGILMSIYSTITTEDTWRIINQSSRELRLKVRRPRKAGGGKASNGFAPPQQRYYVPLLDFVQQIRSCCLLSLDLFPEVLNPNRRKLFARIFSKTTGKLPAQPFCWWLFVYEKLYELTVSLRNFSLWQPSTRLWLPLSKIFSNKKRMRGGEEIQRLKPKSKPKGAEGFPRKTFIKLRVKMPTFTRADWF